MEQTPLLPGDHLLQKLVRLMMTEAHHFTLVAGGAVRMMLEGDAEGVARWQSAITHHRNPLPVFCICFSHPLLVDIIFIPRILHLENLPPLCCMNQTGVLYMRPF